MREIIEDSDDDFQLKFNNPTELIEIFSTLEENNLLEIQRMQESQQELEAKKQQKKDTEAHFERKLAILKANEMTNMGRIEKIKQEKDALLSFQEDNEDQNVDEATMERIDEATRKLYLELKNIKAKPSDIEYSKLQNQSTLSMLNEIEVAIQNYHELFSEYQALDKNIYEVTLRLRTEFRKEIIESNNKRDAQINKKKAEERQRERQQKKFKKIGKMMMKRIHAPSHKKVEAPQKTYTQQEEDFITYGLKNMIEANHSNQ